MLKQSFIKDYLGLFGGPLAQTKLNKIFLHICALMQRLILMYLVMLHIVG